MRQLFRLEQLFRVVQNDLDCALRSGENKVELAVCAATAQCNERISRAPFNEVDISRRRPCAVNPSRRWPAAAQLRLRDSHQCQRRPGRSIWLETPRRLPGACRTAVLPVDLPAPAAVRTNQLPGRLGRSSDEHPFSAVRGRSMASWSGSVTAPLSRKRNSARDSFISPSMEFVDLRTVSAGVFNSSRNHAGWDALIQGGGRIRGNPRYGPRELVFLNGLALIPFLGLSSWSPSEG